MHILGSPFVMAQQVPCPDIPMITQSLPEDRPEGLTAPLPERRLPRRKRQVFPPTNYHPCTDMLP